MEKDHQFTANTGNGKAKMQRAEQDDETKEQRSDHETTDNRTTGRKGDETMGFRTLGPLEFFHYDPYGQTLSTLQRRHDRDLRDARSFRRGGLTENGRVQEM